MDKHHVWFFFAVASAYPHLNGALYEEEEYKFVYEILNPNGIA